MAKPNDIRLEVLSVRPEHVDDRKQNQRLLDAPATQPEEIAPAILRYMPTRETCNKMICWRCKMWMLIVSAVAILTIAITIIVILSIRATPLDDEFIDPNLKIHGTPRYYIGSMKRSSYPFTPGLMMPQSKNFSNLSKPLKNMLNQLYTTSPALRYYFVDSGIFSFSYGSAIAYFWLQFALPKEKDLLIKYTLNTEVLINVLRQHLQTADIGKIMKIEPSSLTLQVANEDYVQSLKTGQCVYHVLLSKEQTFDSLESMQCNRSSSNYWLVQGGNGYSIKATISTKPGGTKCNGVDVATYSTGFLDPKQAVSKFEQIGQPLATEVIVSGNTLLVAFNPTAGCDLLQYSITFLQVPVTECGGVLGGTNGSFWSPRYSNNQEEAINCTWNVKLQEHNRTKIVFKDFKLGGSPKTGESCVTDYLEVDSRRFCGDHRSFCLYSNSSSLQIQFHANQINSKGFAADYMAVDDDLDEKCH